MALNLRKNMCVDIEFVDHTAGTHVIKFVVSGKIATVTKTSVSLDCWRYADPKRRYDDNVTRFTILRSTITRVWKHNPELIFVAPK